MHGEKTIWMARHGETDDNREPERVQGHRDVPLNATGRGQARALARRVADCRVRLASLYCSHLARARETARIVGGALDLEPVVDVRLAESRRGRWEGRRWMDIAESEPEAFAAWKAAGAGFRFPGGESLREHGARVAAALEDVGAAAQPALVVCHGGSIRVALCAADGRGLDAFHDFEVPNGELIRLPS